MEDLKHFSVIIKSQIGHINSVMQYLPLFYNNVGMYVICELKK